MSPKPSVRPRLRSPAASARSWTSSINAARRRPARCWAISLATPHYSTVRTQLRVLEEKGHVTHEEDGVRYVYMPATPRRAARKSALRHLVDTFFDGSAEQVVAAVLGGEGARLSDEELDRIAELIEKAKKEGSR